MDSSWNILEDLYHCESADAANDMAQLWYSMQITGSQAAIQFAKDYAAGTGLGVDQLGLSGYELENAGQLVERLEDSISSYQAQSGTISRIYAELDQ